MDSEKGLELAKRYNRTREAADALHAQAAELLKLAERLEHRTKDTPPGTPPARARVEVGPRWSGRRRYGASRIIWERMKR